MRTRKVRIGLFNGENPRGSTTLDEDCRLLLEAPKRKPTAASSGPDFDNPYQLQYCQHAAALDGLVAAMPATWDVEVREWIDCIVFVLYIYRKGGGVVWGVCKSICS